MILAPDIPAEGGVEYFGLGTDAGQCGVNITKIKAENDGVFKCSVSTQDSNREIHGTVKIIVARK